MLECVTVRFLTSNFTFCHIMTFNPGKVLVSVVSSLVSKLISTRRRLCFEAHKMDHAPLRTGEWVWLGSIKMVISVSPPVQSTSPVHQSSPLVQSSNSRWLKLSFWSDQIHPVTGITTRDPSLYLSDSWTFHSCPVCLQLSDSLKNLGSAISTNGVTPTSRDSYQV